MLLRLTDVWTIFLRSSLAFSMETVNDLSSVIISAFSSAFIVAFLSSSRVSSFFCSSISLSNYGKNNDESIIGETFNPIFYR